MGHPSYRSIARKTNLSVTERIDRIEDAVALRLGEYVASRFRDAVTDYTAWGVPPLPKDLSYFGNAWEVTLSLIDEGMKSGELNYYYNTRGFNSFSRYIDREEYSDPSDETVTIRAWWEEDEAIMKKAASIGVDPGRLVWLMEDCGCEDEIIACEKKLSGLSIWKGRSDWIKRVCEAIDYFYVCTYWPENLKYGTSEERRRVMFDELVNSSNESATATGKTFSFLEMAGLLASCEMLRRENKSNELKDLLAYMYGTVEQSPYNQYWFGNYPYSQYWLGKKYEIGKYSSLPFWQRKYDKRPCGNLS